MINDSIRLIAPAKVNLNLLVTNKFKNGFHCLESDLCFINLYDEILIQRSSYDKIIIDHKNSTHFLKEDTLLNKTLKIFNTEFNNKNFFKITLKKNIPVGAGLGGGSADSAALLLGLRYFYNNDKYNNNKISIKKLKKISIQIGSDVPACISSSSQRLEGIGDKLKKIKIPKNYMLLIVFPNVSLSTRTVFKTYDDLKNRILNINYFENIKIFNSLLIPAQKLEPKIKETLKKLNSFKKIIASGMTGSGSSCFGIFKNEEDFTSQKAYDDLKKVDDFFIWYGNKKEFGYNRILL